MGLTTYQQKRDFSTTLEPKGAVTPSTSGDSFVVQKHAARRLHYDFRLEIEGVLKSWAVTRGPSLVPSEKRLAVLTEDHPLDYGKFEGTIPKGQYGGGTVIVWDRGKWAPIGDLARALSKGHLEFTLGGEKLLGRWHLVRMAGRPREKCENWLLIKGDDAFARPDGAPDILEEQPLSVMTGRSIEEVAVGRSPPNKEKSTPSPKAPKGARKAAIPDFIAPQLATLKPHAPTGVGWVHEIKFDGYRLQARLNDGRVKLLTRSGLDWTSKFGAALPKALASLAASQAVLDGELVVEGAGGASDFSALQADLSSGRADRFVFFAFDLLHLDGYDLRRVPLAERKARLERLLKDAPNSLRYGEHFDEDGDIVLRHACRLSLEGVISKRVQSGYRSGRTKEWIKSKCAERQEMVIGGYVPSTTSESAIGSLVLGVYENGTLRHVGRVGTGFSAAVAADLFRRLHPTERATSPFAGSLDAAARRGVRFVTPKLVAEVEFRAWTASGVLRHASFRGLREDKPAREVVREGAALPEATPRQTSKVRLTHPDRMYWKDVGVTKEGLADHYAQLWKFMAPHVVSRPLALLRCPGGVGETCFFQKHGWKGMSAEVLTRIDPQDDDNATLIAVDSLDGLIGLVQGGALEIHTWQAPVDDLERPDQVVIDLDPGEGVNWQMMVDAAHDVRGRLLEAGLVPFVKTTGGKGLHVVAPLKPKAGWDEVKGFAWALAQAMEADGPERFVSVSTLARRKGRIFVDYLRNGRGATAIAPYSTRARAGATVALPLDWNELSLAIRGDHFTVTNCMARMNAVTADPWAGFRAAAAPLPGGSVRKKRR